MKQQPSLSKIFAIAVVASGLSLGLNSGRAEAAIEARQVTASMLPVRSAPNTYASIQGRVTHSQVYPVIERRGSWIRIQYSEHSGWIYQPYTQLTGTPLSRINASALNVRSGAGSNYRVLGQLPRNTVVAVRGSKGSWRNINYKGGSAWVHSAYLASTSSRPPQSSRPRSRAGFIQLASSGTGFYAYGSSYKRWGRPELVYGIERAARRWNQQYRTRLGVGNISLQNGGYMAPHSSHRRGVDVDVIPMRTDGRELGVTIHQGAYSRTRTRAVLQIFRSEIRTRVVLFNDRYISGVTYWAGHDNHFHFSANY